MLYFVHEHKLVQFSSFFFHPFLQLLFFILLVIASFYFRKYKGEKWKKVDFA